MLTNEERERLIAKALETEEGRAALEEAMSNRTRIPSGIYWDRVGKERKIFSIDVENLNNE